MMIRVKSVEAAAEHYLRNSIRAYLTGERGCNLNWIIGVLHSSFTPEQARTILQAHFPQYAPTERFANLLQTLG